MDQKKDVTGGEPLRILMIERYLYPFGGAQTYMLAVADWLKENGHQVEFFGMHDQRNIVGNSAGVYTRNMDFHTKSLARFTYPFTLLYSPGARRKLKKVIDAFQPDLVHLHGFNFQLTPSVIYEVKARGIPLITTIHDAQIACPCHRLYIEHKGEPCLRCVEGKYGNCVRQRCISGSLAKSVLAAAESYLYHALHTYDQIDRFILPSRFLYNVLLENGIPESKMLVLHNFSRMNRRETAVKKSSGAYALYFGRLSREKGMETLAYACARLPEIPFLIAGSGPAEACFTQLPNVTLLGHVGGAELETLIEGAAFSVYPSEWYENCPMSVLESQALGVPVIGARIGGIPELIEDGKTGVLFTSGSKEELTRVIAQLWSDKTAQQRMRERCLAEQRLSDTNQYCQRLMSEYLNVCVRAKEEQNSCLIYS
jgi:glycosyltransferase involved in cell wall biosynthesis